MHSKPRLVTAATWALCHLVDAVDLQTCLAQKPSKCSFGALVGGLGAWLWVCGKLPPSRGSSHQLAYLQVIENWTIRLFTIRLCVLAQACCLLFISPWKPIETSLCRVDRLETISTSQDPVCVHRRFHHTVPNLQTSPLQARERGRKDREAVQRKKQASGAGGHPVR